VNDRPPAGSPPARSASMQPPVATPLTVEVVGVGAGSAVVRAEGVIDLNTASRLERVLTDAVAAGQIRLVLDLSGVGLCDSTGLTVLIRAHRSAVAAGGWLRLAGAQPPVRRLLEITNLERVFALYPSVDDARAA
jgi:anti-sigma B factor antagonist